MTEHLIRFRGGWEVGDPDAPPGAPTSRRLSLPTVWPPDAPARVRLVRSFQAPPLDPATETLGLRLVDVDGLKAVELNGQTLPLPGAGPGPLWLPLTTPLPRRNLLTLHVDRPGPARNSGPEPPWGQVALVIRARDPSENPTGG